MDKESLFCLSLCPSFSLCLIEANARTHRTHKPLDLLTYSTSRTAVNRKKKSYIFTRSIIEDYLVLKTSTKKNACINSWSSCCSHRLIFMAWIGFCFFSVLCCPSFAVRPPLPTFPFHFLFTAEIQQRKICGIFHRSMGHLALCDVDVVIATEYRVGEGLNGIQLKFCVVYLFAAGARRQSPCRRGELVPCGLSQ